jgi:hypothetical protein
MTTNEEQTKQNNQNEDNEVENKNDDMDEQVDNNDEQVDNNDEPIYPNKLANRVIVTVNGNRPRNKRPRLQFYVDRARRILRSDETVTVTGLGQAISMACTLVEVLKRQKIAEIESVRTSVDVDPTFYGGKLSWGRPVTAIRFVLKRGEHAEYVSDYHQRKVIEIFENRDKDKTGKLAKTIIQGLNMGEIFFAGEERINQAAEFLKGINGDSLNLPDFIRYASILIHPLLKDRIFKEQLNRKFGIDENDNEDNNEEIGDDDEEDNEH